MLSREEQTRFRNIAAATRARAQQEAAELPAPPMRVTSYEVSLLPEDHPARPSATLTVAYRGRDRWAVTRHGYCLSVDGTWSHEPLVTERTEEWLAEHRFDEQAALRLARHHAPLITLGRYTVSDLLTTGTEEPP